ncbi:MAG: hypothetical protein GX116_03175 [Fibrobacter sp.]|nr:hypothetical protein [Fibrobacter sp.]
MLKTLFITILFYGLLFAEENISEYNLLESNSGQNYEFNDSENLEYDSNKDITAQKSNEFTKKETQGQNSFNFNEVKEKEPNLEIGMHPLISVLNIITVTNLYLSIEYPINDQASFVLRPHFIEFKLEMNFGGFIKYFEVGGGIDFRKYLNKKKEGLFYSLDLFFLYTDLFVRRRFDKDKDFRKAKLSSIAYGPMAKIGQKVKGKNFSYTIDLSASYSKMHNSRQNLDNLDLSKYDFFNTRFKLNLNFVIALLL